MRALIEVPDFKPAARSLIELRHPIRLDLDNLDNGDFDRLPGGHLHRDLLDDFNLLHHLLYDGNALLVLPHDRLYDRHLDTFGMHLRRERLLELLDAHQQPVDAVVALGEMPRMDLLWLATNVLDSIRVHLFDDLFGDGLAHHRHVRHHSHVMTNGHLREGGQEGEIHNVRQLLHAANCC